MTSQNDKEKDKKDLLDIANPLLGLPESQPIQYAYQTYGAASQTTAYYTRLSEYSLVSQPSLSLSYSPDAHLSKLLNTKESNTLFVQANSQLPLFVSALAVLPAEFLLAALQHGPLSGCLPLVMFGLVYGAWKGTWRIQKAAINRNRDRLDKAPDSVKIPDRIMLSGEGIQFMWTTKACNFTSFCMRWSKIRLVYLEKEPESEEGSHFICIRTSSGGLLRLHSSGFASKEQEQLFCDTLRARAPQAFQGAPLNLAVQPERKGWLSHTWSWFKCYWSLRCNRSPSPRLVDRTVDSLIARTKSAYSAPRVQRFLSRRHSADENTHFEKNVEAIACEINAAESGISIHEGSTLQQGRYKIVKKFGTSTECTSYLAEAVDPLLGSRVYSTYADQGGQGSTFGAQMVTIREYALPPATMPTLDHEDHYDRFIARSEQASRLDNKRILRWMDQFIQNGRAYMVFEYCPGTTIRQHIKEHGPMSEKRVLGLALQMADILTYLHTDAPCAVHGNFTPDSMTIDPSGNLKLTGMTTFLQTPSKELGGPVGRPGYMAPEQLRGSPCKQSDIYAMGATLYFMLTGEDPLPLQKCQPKLKVENISDTINSLIGHATEQNLPQRFENIEMLKRQLIQSEAEHLITRLIS